MPSSEASLASPEGPTVYSNDQQHAPEQFLASDVHACFNLVCGHVHLSMCDMHASRPSADSIPFLSKFSIYNRSNLCELHAEHLTAVAGCHQLPA